jgi:manganese transport protein
MPETRKDFYHISEQTIRIPPGNFFQRLKFLGPGFILSASIVGSGELIATTTLGAQAGFVAFWVILISCLVKVAVQLEVGKHTILTGETAMDIFNNLHGPRLGKAKLTVWLFALLLLLKLVQLGGMTGSTAIVLNLLFPAIPISLWVLFAAGAVSLLIYRGYYRVVEKLSLFMIAMFTILTISAVAALSFTEYSISWTEIASGLTFHLPKEIVAVAIGAFGITGVASDEIIAYNYWCLEKGYAAYTGPKKNTTEWKTRAEGWIKVMYLDALVAMVIYTLVTAAFYLLGAAILHNRGLIPQGNQLIETVALIYTESLGPGIRTIYLVGAFFVLFSSLFATLAAWTRMYPDILGQLGWIDFSNVTQRNRLIAMLAWIIPMLWAILYLFISLPVIMILFGGAVGSVLLFLVVYAALTIHLRRESSMPAGWMYKVAFWISILSIFAVGVYGVIGLF